MKLDIYVIIPAYNAEEYIYATVHSVLQQPYKKIKIVIVDDGSTDGTLKQSRQLETLYPQVCVLHRKNGGVSNARNMGIEYAVKTGADDAYIAFLDADDSWYPNYLTDAIVDELTAEQHDIYAFSMLNSDEPMQRFSAPARYEQQTVPGGNTGIWKITNHFASCLYHITLFRKWNIRFFSGYKYSEDKFFKLQCAFFAKSIQLRPELMYIYRENSTGAMKKSNELTSIEYYLPIINGWLESDQFINRWSNETGVTTHCGYSLASIYFLDMSAAHLMRHGRAAEIKRTIKEHPHYPCFLEMRMEDVGEINYRNQQLLLHHPHLYAWKYRLRGMIENPLRAVSYWKPIRHFINQRKYPLSQLP